MYENGDRLEMENVRSLSVEMGDVREWRWFGDGRCLKMDNSWRWKTFECGDDLNVDGVWVWRILVSVNDVQVYMLFGYE